MADLQIPRRTFFRYFFACPYCSRPPRIDGNLREWEEIRRIPDLMGIEGRPAFASLYVSWDDSGLYLGLEVRGKTRYKIDPRHFTRGDCLEVWIDTRDVKEAHRANRYCHRFYFLPGGSGGDGKAPIGRQAAIEQAREQAPPCPEDSIQVGLRRLKRKYQMEIKLPAEGLNGFQPGEFDRIGFAYLLHDSQHGVQSWPAGEELLVDRDPSRWGTIELRPPDEGNL